MPSALFAFRSSVWWYKNKIIIKKQRNGGKAEKMGKPEEEGKGEKREKADKRELEKGEQGEKLLALFSVLAGKSQGSLLVGGRRPLYRV